MKKLLVILLIIFTYVRPISLNAATLTQDTKIDANYPYYLAFGAVAGTIIFNFVTGGVESLPFLASTNANSLWEGTMAANRVLTALSVALGIIIVDWSYKNLGDCEELQQQQEQLQQQLQQQQEQLKQQLQKQEEQLKQQLQKQQEQLQQQQLQQQEQLQQQLQKQQEQLQQQQLQQPQKELQQPQPASSPLPRRILDYRYHNISPHIIF